MLKALKNLLKEYIIAGKGKWAAGVEGNRRYEKGVDFRDRRKCLGWEK